MVENGNTTLTIESQDVHKNKEDKQIDSSKLYLEQGIQFQKDDAPIFLNAFK